MIAADWIFLIVLAFAIALVIGYRMGRRNAKQAWMIEAQAQILDCKNKYAALENLVCNRNKDQVKQAVAAFRGKAKEYLDERSAKVSNATLLLFLAAHLERNEPDDQFNLARFHSGLGGVPGFGADFFEHLSSLPKTATRQEAAVRIRELVEQKASKP